MDEMSSGSTSYEYVHAARDLTHLLVQNAQPMFSLILYEPEIPPNTGNIIRLCANTGTKLNLVKPLGFELDEPRLKRAGLDYREFAAVAVHNDLPACLSALKDPRVFAMSTRGHTDFSMPRFREGDAFLFGPETRGLPQEVLDSLISRAIMIFRKPDSFAIDPNKILRNTKVAMVSFGIVGES